MALPGPRQVGQTTLAIDIGKTRPSIYLDLESEADRAKLSEPELYLASHGDKLVILDEVHRLPNVSQILRGLIDRNRRAGRRTGQFLLLGSASIDLLKQSGETLAGRIAYLEMQPADGLEVPAEALDRLWLRGGFPDSFLAASDRGSLRWRRNFIRTYLERDIPLLGPRIPAEPLRRFWTMLAHHRSELLNAAELARSLGVDGKTVASYLDLLVACFSCAVSNPGMPISASDWSNHRKSTSGTAALRMHFLDLEAPSNCLGTQLSVPAGKVS